jgi:hypothetical protein
MPVGEEQNPVRRPLVQVGRHVLPALQPPAGEIGAAAALDALDQAGQALLLVTGRGWCDGLHGVVERHDAHRIFREQPAHEQRTGVPGRPELLSGHGAGAVEDQRQVQRYALSAGGRLAFQLQESSNGVAARGDDELVIDEDLWFHWRLR